MSQIVEESVETSLLSKLQPWLPKSIVCVQEGYGRQYFLNDLFAGITVGIIALPLAMAFAINSGPGLTPERGLYTAIIAGFVCACLSGSRVSIAGPTGAFMPILYQIVSQHGYDGLAIASVMAGVMLIFMGLAKLGSMIKFIPYPVTTGFTSGIAVIIFSSQMKDLFGLQMGTPASEFIYKWVDYAHAAWAHGVNPMTTSIGIGGIVIIILCRRFIPRVPGPIVAVILAAALVTMLHLDDKERWGNWAVATIGTNFKGGLPRQMPTPQFGFFHSLTYDKFRELLSPAATIAMLAAIESLLCCVVADGMIGSRHRSNTELISQGLGNIASVCFGGIPATGAIARTAANIKSGGRTPLAGIVHAAVVLICMLAFAPLAAKIPMAVFASILVVVAWNMSEKDHFKTLLSSPRSDIAVLLVTFGLTVLVDLTVAVGFGMISAAVLFMKRMSEVTNVNAVRREIDEVGDEFPELSDPKTAEALKNLPAGVEVYEINGPFFFGVADRLKDTLAELERPPKIFILRMRRVNAIDATGLHALDEFRGKCLKQGTRLLLSGVHAQPMFAMGKYGLIDKIGEDNMCGDIDEAIEVARGLLAKK
jgi:SulP family sulfate permease